MKKCNMTQGCKKTATYNVTHKAFMALKERHVLSCAECAARIGSRSKMGAVIDMPNMENTFYKLEAL